MQICMVIISSKLVSIPRKSKPTKLCPLVVGNPESMDHPKDHSLFGLGLPGYS